MWLRSIIKCITCVCLFAGAPVAFADGAHRATVSVVPAKERVAQLSARAREVVAELDGDARGSRLVGMLEAAEKSGALYRLALELQSVEHEDNGNLLFKVYLEVRDDVSEERALGWVEKLAYMGVAVGPSTGYFQSLAHLDPDEPVPAEPRAELAGVPMWCWVDSFVAARYEVGYRPNRKGALSEMLQLEYKDGRVVDVDIRVISDNRDMAGVQAVARSYLGPGGLIYPLRLSRDATPRLWRAKHDVALAGMYHSNREFEDFVSIGLAGILSSLPVGAVVGVDGPSAASSSRGGRMGASSRAGSRAGKGAGVGKGAKVSKGGKSGRAEGQGASAGGSKGDGKGSKEPSLSWPPKAPEGEKPALGQPGAAEWRYQRYAHRAYKEGRKRSEILDYATWKERHYEPAVRGGRPGRPGSPAHKADVKRNNIPNGMESERVGDRFPDGVGQPGQSVTIRGLEIKPAGLGRVIVESDRTIAKGAIPDSAARAQVRDIRKADPDATIVVTDHADPRAAPLIYPPGTQPPPPGPLPPNTPPRVPYP